MLKANTFQIVLSSALCLTFGMTLNTSATEHCSNAENSSIIATTPRSHFTDNNDGTVTHNDTGLIWQSCSAGQVWEDGTCNGSALNFYWQSALQYATENTFLGLSDWRLPNINELASIVERRCWDPAINSQVFPNTTSGMYLTSSSEAGLGAGGLIVHFANGYISSHSKIDSDGYVRLVRGGK